MAAMETVCPIETCGHGFSREWLAGWFWERVSDGPNDALLIDCPGCGTALRIPVEPEPRFGAAEVAGK